MTAAVLGPSFRLEDAAEIIGECPAALLPVYRGDDVRRDHDRRRERVPLPATAAAPRVRDMVPQAGRTALHRQYGHLLLGRGELAVQAAGHLLHAARPGDQASLADLDAAARQTSRSAPETAARLALRALELTPKRGSRRRCRARWRPPRRWPAPASLTRHFGLRVKPWRSRCRPPPRSGCDALCPRSCAREARPGRLPPKPGWRLPTHGCPPNFAIRPPPRICGRWPNRTTRSPGSPPTRSSPPGAGMTGRPWSRPSSLARLTAGTRGKSAKRWSPCATLRAARPGSRAMPVTDSRCCRSPPP